MVRFCGFQVWGVFIIAFHIGEAEVVGGQGVTWRYTKWLIHTGSHSIWLG